MLTVSKYCRLLCLGLFLPFVPVKAEWKEFKLLKSYVKTSDIGKGRELVKKCLADTLISRDPKLYSLARSLEVKANDAENMKLYLHQKYDTTGFFNSVCSIFEYTLKEEAIVCSTHFKQAEKTRKKNRAFLKRYYPNLYRGGVFFIKNKQWASADKLFSMYIDIARSDYFKGEKQMLDSRLPRAAFWSMASCFEGKNFKDVFKYQSLAEADSANFDYALQYETMAYEGLRDTANYVKSLRRGLGESSFSDFFFSRLADFLSNTRKYQEAYQLNDSLLTLKPDNKLYLFAQVAVLFNLKQYDKCISMAERLLSVDSEDIQTFYYIGLCWYNKGVSYESTLSPNPTSTEYKKRMEEVRIMYRTAMPYLERYKDAYPNDKSKWQIPLYKIYFSLNMVDKLNNLEK